MVCCIVYPAYTHPTYMYNNNEKRCCEEVFR